MPKTPQASRTAVLVCQGRAAADGLIAPGRFTDPTAVRLLRTDEREIVLRVREGAVPHVRPPRGPGALTASTGRTTTAKALATAIRHRRSLSKSRVMVADRR